MVKLIDFRCISRFACHTGAFNTERKGKYLYQVKWDSANIASCNIRV